MKNDVNNTRWVERYMGIPFKEDGMTRRGLNCYGLIRIVLLEQAGIELVEYKDLTSDEMILAAEEISLRSIARPWLPVEPGQEKTFDCVVMKALLGRGQVGEGHVGIVTKPGWVLHIERNCESVHVPYREDTGTHITMARRVLRIVRHEALQ